MYEEKQLKSADGTAVSCRFWKVPTPDANVLLIHGYTDHSGRYEEVAEKLNSRNISVFGFDLRGHGKSGGERTTISSFNEYLEDVEAVAREIDAPFYILGHSMGGLITVKYALKNSKNIQGLFLTAPSLIQNASASKFKIKLVLFLSKLLAKKRSKIKIDPELLSTDKAIVQDYVNDPLVNNLGANWKFLGELMRAMNSIPDSVTKLDLPVTIFHDKEDKLANVEGSRLLIDKCASKEKTLTFINGRGHELLQGENSKVILDSILNQIPKEIVNLQKI